MAFVDGLQGRTRGDAVAHLVQLGHPSPQLVVERVLGHAAHGGNDAVDTLQPLAGAGRQVFQQHGGALQASHRVQGQDADALLAEARPHRQHAVDGDMPAEGRGGGDHGHALPQVS